MRAWCRYLLLLYISRQCFNFRLRNENAFVMMKCMSLVVPQIVIIWNKMSLFWINFPHWLWCNLSKWITSLQPVTKFPQDSDSSVLTLKFFRGSKNIYLHIIPPHWHDTGSWNPSVSKTRTYLPYTVNIMGADVLATQGARATATMIFIMLNRINSVPAH